MKFLHFTFIFFSLIVLACDTDVNNEDNKPLELISDDSVSIDSQTTEIDSQTTEKLYKHITFNEILNNPYQFNIDEELYSFYLTDKLNYSRSKSKKPKVGLVETIHISGKSADFGAIDLRILLNEYICFENLIENIELGIEYICQIQIYTIEKNDSIADVILWADLLSKPERM